MSAAVADELNTVADSGTAPYAAAAVATADAVAVDAAAVEFVDGRAPDAVAAHE